MPTKQESLQPGDDPTEPAENSNLHEIRSQSDEPTREAIAKRAYELWIENGSQIGFHETDWNRAEEQLRAQGGQDKQKTVPHSPEKHLEGI